MTEIPILNFYDVIDKKYLKPEVKFANQELVKMTIPLRMIISGASGSYKTSSLMNILTIFNCFNRVYLFCPNHQQPIYNWLKDYYKNIEKSMNMKAGSIFTIIETFEDLPNIDTDIDVTKNNIIIFDDVINEKAASMKKMQEFFTRGRTKSISAVFISQKYHSIPIFIRTNADYLILKRVAQITDLTRIAREYAMDITPKQITSLYKYATAKKTDWFMIDTQTSDQNLRYRRNFTGIPLNKHTL